jgi:drug/metabolite transporter (DMT)-like permease
VARYRIPVIFALLAAAGSAVCYGVASVLQALGARSTHDTGTVDPRLLGRLLRNTPFLVGVLLDVTGAVLQFLALRTLPLFLVQAMQAGNLAVTALVAVPVLGARLAARHWWAVAAVTAGLILLATAAGAQNPREPGFAFRLTLLACVALLTAAGVVAGRIGVGGAVGGALGGRAGGAAGGAVGGAIGGAAGASAGAVPVGGSELGGSVLGSSVLGGSVLSSSVLGAVAGLGFGLTALAARSLTNLSPAHLVRDPALYAAVGGGVVAFLFFATGLQRGSVTAVSAAVVVGETAVPAVVGILVLGDHTRPGFAAVAVVGFLLAVAGALALSRFGEPRAAA